MTKILMVCLGNICRSPLAEGILKSKLSEEKFIIESAGTANYHIGELPDKRSIEIALQHDINIT
ncbi:MAG: low molecular weight phosphotyrosine protein phosphatase, partial [Bacteroidia bacterium]|nr:low molecular weight phosphotyrosine protein phosphatase [Bacteroidia bacterium]